MSNILNIGKTALLAAQIGIETTGHNISNAKTTGYSRQIVVQGAVAGQDIGVGYVGKGTEVLDIRRVFSDFTSGQVRSSQTSYSQLNTYYNEIQQIDNMLSDSTVGLSPTLQSFFSGVQDLASTASGSYARQSLLSSGNTLVSQFNSISQRLTEISEGVNSQIASSVTKINTYAVEIGQLNDAIERSVGQSDGASMPNDLLDQRDQLVAELSKEIRVSVVKQGNSYNVFIGNGQTLVNGGDTYSLVSIPSATDQSRMEVAYQNPDGSATVMTDNLLSGGNLTGLLAFRSETLDVAQNSIGRMAAVLASTFNDQHKLGTDLSGAMGGDFFSFNNNDYVTPSTLNTSNAVVGSSITNAKLLTTSDYQLSFDGTNYTLSRLSDGVKWSDTSLATLSTTVSNSEGFNLALSSGAPASGDKFLIRPTANAASSLSMKITDASKIAAGSPVLTAAGSSNSGTGKISDGTVNTPVTLTPPISKVTITFSDATHYTVTGDATVYTYAPATGASISYNGWTVQLSGAPSANDTFTVGPSSTGDNRNAKALGSLQTTNLVAGSTTTLQGAYSQLVNMIGNKTSELEATSAAAKTVYTSAYTAQQSESGVNLDEEAANLLHYQQAYQAAAKMMQIAGTLFDSLLAIGG